MKHLALYSIIRSWKTLHLFIFMLLSQITYHNQHLNISVFSKDFKCLKLNLTPFVSMIDIIFEKIKFLYLRHWFVNSKKYFIYFYLLIQWVIHCFFVKLFIASFEIYLIIISIVFHFLFAIVIIFTITFAIIYFAVNSEFAVRNGWFNIL